MKQIIITEEELKELALCTEMNSHLSLGRTEELGNKGFSLFINNIDVEKIGVILDKIKGMILPNKEKSKFLDLISQTLKYNYTSGKYPNGGVTSWFSKPRNISSSFQLNIKEI